jgi:Transposase DDE domain group 1
MSSSQRVMEFPLLSRKSVLVDFTGGHLSSDGGLLLLAQLDQKLGLTKHVAAALKEYRAPNRLHHSLLDLIRQRVYQIACGYEDANDAATLRFDPVFKVACGRAPLQGRALASQPTLSRLETTLSEYDAEAINPVLLQQFLDTPRRTPKSVILDLDTSEHTVHGQQTFAFYNDHYGSTCYLPRFCFASVPGEPDQYLVRAMLPDHHGEETDAILDDLEEIVKTIRKRWPGVLVKLRADAGFADPELYTWCEKNGVAYAVAMAGNEVLSRLSAKLRERAQALAAASPTGSATLSGKVRYQAGSWEKLRIVVAKVTVTPAGTKVRYLVVRGLPGSAKARSQFYRGRGDSENRIKELKEGVRSDRMSCCELASNKVRLMLTMVAYVLLQQMRRLARRTGLATAQVARLRLELIKIGARVTESQRRVWVALCSSCPSQGVWRELARRIGVVAR